MNRSYVGKLLVCLLVAVAVSGCTTFTKKRTIDYKSTRTLPPLEVPPDLSTLPQSRNVPPGAAPSPTATYSEYTKGRGVQQTGVVGSAVLPEYPDMKIERDGQQRWLVVKAKPEALWPRVRDFILNNGLLIAKENPRTGILETDWAENRAQVGSKIQKVLAKWMSSLYSTGTRDKFRIRLERGTTPDTTEIYLSHRGMKEVVAEGGGTDAVQTLWQPRPPDPELEAEMLRLLMVHLGAEQRQAEIQLATGQTEERAALIRDGEGNTLLSLQDSLDRAWRRVGLSLDRIGFTVEDRNRSEGIYYVRYIDPENTREKKGFFSKIFKRKKQAPARNQYQIYLEATDPGTNVKVLGEDGAPDKSKTSDRILSLLYEQLK